MSRPGILSRFRPVPAKDDEEGTNLKSPVEDGGKIKKMAAEEGVQLKRQVGLFSAVFLIVGTMIGSGIFISPKGVLIRSGSVAMSLLVWAGCGAIALMGALSYAELGTAIPVSGAEYSYYLRVYGQKGRFGPIPAFLYLWMCSIIIKPSAVSIMLLTFAEYVVEPMFPTCPAPILAKKLVAIVAICFITFINCYSVKMATMMNNVFTVAKLLAIAIVVLVGMYRLMLGHYEHLNTGFEGTTTSFSDLATAFYFGLWAYDGWNNLNFVTEELINPPVNLPRAIMIGIPLVTLCYVLTNISYLTVLSPSELLSSEAVAVGFANYILGPAAFIIPILVAASAYGASNGTALIASRLPFVAARQGHSAELMSYVQVQRLTPAPALLFNGLIVLLMIAAGNIGSLIDFFSFVAWMFYGGTVLTVIVMRFTEKDLPRPYKVPIIIPCIMVVIAAYLVLAPIIEDPRVEYFYALLFLLSGMIFYIPFVHFNIRLRLMEKFTHLMQLLFNCAPAENVPG
ncbi:b(0,+)-type amino acid transporter 1-like [Stegodyphus dumicola]|uniref:b(0,+)-type amino acid transporter 1-like n=1 Tax=Stegodyphus dumicola TaxID=202533 RepID=UPI0015AA2382|nr:b(0,+)-type amino acid transporter 1-like [Stegodyphus dumicola]